MLFFSHPLAMPYNLEIQDCFFLLLKWKRKEVQALHPPPPFLLDFMGVAEFRPLQGLKVLYSLLGAGVMNRC